MFPISGRTDIISIIENEHYGIATRIEKDVEKVTVYKNRTKVGKHNYTKLPNDIQQIVEKPFTTELIYFLSTYNDTTGPDPVRYTMLALEATRPRTRLHRALNYYQVRGRPAVNNVLFVIY